METKNKLASLKAWNFKFKEKKNLVPNFWLVMYISRLGGSFIGI